jgi:beta-lactam-binding protein with PASTA domain
MPDVRGLSAREAVRALTRLGLVPQMTGAGFVLEQTPAPGAPLADGEACVVKLGRGPLAAAGGSQ